MKGDLGKKKTVLIFKEVPTYYAMEDSWRENTFV